MAIMIGSESFAGSILLIIAILLGLVAAVMTYMNSRKLKGEVFEKPFIYFSGGIFLVTLSLISVTFLQNTFSSIAVRYIHDLSFIAGLGLMLFSSMKITKFALGVDEFEKNLPSKKDSKEEDKVKKTKKEEEGIKIK